MYANLWLSLVPMVLFVATAAQAQTIYWTKDAVLNDFFSDSESVELRIVKISDEAQEKLRQRLGYTPQREFRVYYGTTNGNVDGFAVIDNELGQHMPITFAVLIGTDGLIRRLEVMVYRESHGSEVQGKRFRKQFSGKSSKHLFRAGRDIDAVSGATISSASLAKGAKRAVTLVEELVLPQSPKDWIQTGSL